jgi:hypothetical protein
MFRVGTKEQNRAEQNRTDGTEQMFFDSELEQKFSLSERVTRDLLGTDTYGQRLPSISEPIQYKTSGLQQPY